MNKNDHDRSFNDGGPQEKFGAIGLRRLMQGGAITLGVRIAGVVLSLALTVALSRLMGMEEFGRYSFLFALTTLLTILAQIGLPEYLMRETAKSYRSGQSIPRRLWQWARNTLLLISSGIALFAITLFSIDKIPTGDIYAFTLCLIIVPLVAYSNLIAFTLRGIGQLVIAQVADMVLRPVLSLAAIGGAVLLSVPMVSATGLIALAAGAAGSLLVLSVVLRKRMPNLSNSSEDTSAPDGALSSAIYLGLVSGLYLLQSNVDLIMLGMLRPDNEVAIYKIASSLAGVAAFGLMATNFVISPNLSALFLSGDLKTLERLSKNSARISFVLALSGALALSILGQIIINVLFGQNYSAAYIPLMILIAGPVARSAFGPIENVLSATHREKVLFRIMLTAVAGNILLNLVLIPTMGLIGASISTAITIFASNCFLWRKGRRMLGIDTSALR